MISGEMSYRAGWNLRWTIVCIDVIDPYPQDRMFEYDRSAIHPGMSNNWRKI